MCGKFRSAKENIDRWTIRELLCITAFVSKHRQSGHWTSAETGSKVGMCAKVASFGLSRRREGIYMLVDFSYPQSVLCILHSYLEKSREQYWQWHLWNGCFISLDERVPALRGRFKVGSPGGLVTEAWCGAFASFSECLRRTDHDNCVINGFLSLSTNQMYRNYTARILPNTHRLGPCSRRKHELY